MANLFFRTSIAPYRVDTYNALNSILDCKMYFMSKTDDSQDFKTEKIDSRCHFKPIILKKKKFLGIPYYADIWKYIKENKPKTVIVPEFKLITIQALVFKWLFNRSLKVISMCDDSYDMVANGKDFTRTHTIARKVITPFLDDLLLVDKKVKDWYQNHYQKGIWMPIIRDEKVEIPLYRQAERLSSDFESKFHLQGKKILLYVGRLVDVKNLPTLLEAVRMTKSDYTTIIVGDGPMKDQLQEQAKLTGKDILFVGRFDDDEIRAWFNIADVFVLPSTKEAFGAVTNEALLGGCFPLISRACGSACLIDETNGRLFDPNSPKELADLIDTSFLTLPPASKKLGNRMSLSFDKAVVDVIKQLKNQ